MPITNTLKKFIDNKGITRYQLAKDTAISRTTIYSLYDNPKAVPRASILAKICDFYLVDICEIIVWTAPKKRKSPATSKIAEKK